MKKHIWKRSRRVMTMVAVLMIVIIGAACLESGIVNLAEAEAGDYERPPEGARPPFPEDDPLGLGREGRQDGRGPVGEGRGPLGVGPGLQMDGNQTMNEPIQDQTLNESIQGLEGSYTINDTGQSQSYDNYQKLQKPKAGDPFFGQDSNYTTNAMDFVDNGDGTVSDLNTGLMWTQNVGDKMTYAEAVAYAESFTYGGYDDWRLPTIKELYSLIDFSGNTVDIPYIDTEFFEFHWGDETGERAIDSQYATSTLYGSTTMDGNETKFGVNFADGRIKGYPTSKLFYVMMVRGNEAYGDNLLVDNGDGTISDLATGLMWMKYDSGYLLEDGTLNWQEGLEWAENLDYAGYDDWKVPDAKELQSIVDYTRSPDTTDSPAIDPIFDSTFISNLLGQEDYGYYWTSTTHAENNGGMQAVYISFGRALGSMFGQVMDVHGAGAQRSDPKTGDESDYPEAGYGPQGDVRVVYNFVRAVRVIED